MFSNFEALFRLVSFAIVAALAYLVYINYLVYQEQHSKIYEPKSTSHYTSLPTATSDSLKLISTALDVLRKIYFSGRNYKKAAPEGAACDMNYRRLGRITR